MTRIIAPRAPASVAENQADLVTTEDGASLKAILAFGNKHLSDGVSESGRAEVEYKPSR